MPNIPELITRCRVAWLQMEFVLKIPTSAGKATETVGLPNCERLSILPLTSIFTHPQTFENNHIRRFLYDQ
jgi:hypothetical protein